MGSSTIPSEVSILIIGAGPVGLALACTLLNKGVPPSSVLILERQSLAQKNAHHHQSRALAIHARTLECLEESVDDLSAPPPSLPTESKPSITLAVDEVIKSTVQTILDRALIADRMVIRHPRRLKALLTNSFTLLRDETRYPFVSIHPQGSTESILQSRLHTLGGTLQREWSFESFETENETSIGQPVKVKLANSSGEIVEVQTKILIGADGGHSRVRANAGIEFTGYTYSETFILGDVKLESPGWPYLTEDGWNGYEVTQVMSQAGWLFLIPLPGGLLRVAADEAESVMDLGTKKALSRGGHTEDRKTPTQAELQAVLDKRGPKVKVNDGRNMIKEVAWSSRFHISHRIASTFTKGPICLIGDAAHVHSPAGGQGLNTGVQDAISLGLVLSGFFQASSSLSHEASVSLSQQLESWSSKRHVVATQVLSLTRRATNFITLRNPVLIWLRSRLMLIIGLFPVLIKRALRTMMGLNNR